jgi:hypothetical protein
MIFSAIMDSISVGVAVDGEATFSANYAIASTAASFATATTINTTTPNTSFAVVYVWA